MQICWWRVKEVHNLLVVNLKVRALNQELHVRTIQFCFLSLMFNASEYVLEGSLHKPALLERVTCGVLGWDNLLLACNLWIDCWTLDREGLSGAGLTVREDSTVVALQTTICYRLCNALENLLLGRVLIRDIVKRKIPRISSTIKRNLLLIVNQNATLWWSTFYTKSLRKFTYIFLARSKDALWSPLVHCESGELCSSKYFFTRMKSAEKAAVTFESLVATCLGRCYLRDFGHAWLMLNQLKISLVVFSGR